MQVCSDWRDEADVCHAFFRTLEPSDWERPTGFMDWTPWDVVAHLHFFDLVSQAALAGGEVFRQRREALVRGMAAGVSNAEAARRELGPLAPDALLSRWIDTCHGLADALAALDPRQRLPWFGPDMGAQMFTTARFMETWAHAQEIYDLKGVKRTYDDRIRHVAVIGVKTFGWTFVNRGLEPPGAPPRVELIAPSGATWSWNQDNLHDSVSGDAAELCHVVTQGRNVADTRLEVRGDVARQWLAIAQCFAGAPADPPAPGTRLPRT